MIQLADDYLVFQLNNGESIPCSAELVSIELMGESASLFDREFVQHAATAVLHYFKQELGRDSVTVGEFSVALERVLRGFGLSANMSESETLIPRMAEADLRRLASDSGKGFELVFFPRLRRELQDQLRQSPQMLRFHGLRGCVKQLIGARRWSARCQILQDQIVEFLRTCLCVENRGAKCGLLVK
jgi:hypothetical protein